MFLVNKHNNAAIEEDAPIIEETIAQNIERPSPPSQSGSSNPIRISKKEDVYEKREKLIQYLWKQDKLPKELPDKIEKNVDNLIIIQADGKTHPFDTSDLDNLKSMDKITIDQEHDINSVIYHLHPKKKNNKLVFYNDGHGGKLEEGQNAKSAINSFLKEGYSVMIAWVPLSGQNNKPIIETEKGVVDLTDYDRIIHKKFSQLETNEFSPLKLFANPLAIAVNYAEQEYNYKEIHMVGLSGGGWATTFYSALDERVLKSYPIAGTLPLDFPGGGRDYEQNLPGIKDIVNYRELYLMGSFGKNRKQIQILNKNDPCCFQGSRYLGKPYENEIDNVLESLGGNKNQFSVFIADARKHVVAESSIQKILGKIIKSFRKDKVYEDSEISEQIIELILNDLSQTQ